MAQNPKWDVFSSDRIIVIKEKKLFHNQGNYRIPSESTGTVEVLGVITPGAKASLYYRVIKIFMSSNKQTHTHTHAQTKIREHFSISVLFDT